MVKHITLCLCLIFCFSLVLQNRAFAQFEQHEIQVDFSFDTANVTDKQVIGYRLYMEELPICETGPVDPQSFTCIIESEYGTFDFTISALFDDQSESPQSSPFPLTIEESTTTPTESCANTTGSKAFILSWDHQSTTNITSHRFYLNNKYICETYDTSINEVTVNADLLVEEMSFSMSSVSADGVESKKSNILTFNPNDFPELFKAKLVSLEWDYDSASAISGFKVYHNNSFLCETEDPLSFQIDCEAELADSNVFTLTSLLTDGSESNISNTIVYTKEPGSSEAGPPAASIAVSSMEGEAPFTPSFDGSGSSGAIQSYTWSFGDGDAATGATVQHTFKFPGTYTATLTVASAAGIEDTESVIITATEPPAPPEPTLEQPTVVLSSSNAIGEAPFLVSFDGSGSSTKQPPMISYNWDFGDGSSSAGAVTSHTYNTAGTYQATLTVVDSAGLSSSTSTPIVVTESSIEQNQAPQAVISLSQAVGKAPLNVVFSGSESTDPDGSITSYVWNFGDGSSATGTSVQHTFENAADYTISLEVTDDKGQKAIATTTISALTPDEVPFAYELGELEITSEWNRIDLNQTFVDPVIVAGPLGSADLEPATVRIRNIDSTGFEIRIQEWDYLDGQHQPELLSFIAMEKGAYALPDGTRFEAGIFDASSSYKTINLQQTYGTEPVVLTQVISESDNDAVSGRVRRVKASSFEYMLQEQESTKTSHGSEKVAYVAWQPGSGEISSGIFLEAGTTADAIKHNWASITFQNELPGLPFFIAGAQTTDGGDTATIRMRDSSAKSVEVRVEEEQSLDSETNHTTEVVGYLVFSAQNPQESTENSLERLFTFTWQYGDTTNVSGFKFYLNGSEICETTDPADRQISCNATLLNEIMEFTMTAVFTDGSESEQSQLLSLDPAEFPSLFGVKLVSFSWDFDTSMEGTIAGFSIYHNDNKICETNNPSARELSCEVQLNPAVNNFEIRAIENAGAESSPSNNINYIP